MSGGSAASSCLTRSSSTTTPSSWTGLSELVRGDGFTIETAATFAQAKALLEKRVPDLLLLDVTLPDGSGFELMSLVEETPSTDVVVITGHSSVDTAVEALRQRATDYLTKPLDVARLRAVLEQRHQTARAVRGGRGTCVTSSDSSDGSGP